MITPSCGPATDASWNREPGYAVIAEANSGEEGYLLLQSTTPDVVILDLSMPGGGGLRHCGASNCAGRSCRCWVEHA